MSYAHELNMCDNIQSIRLRIRVINIIWTYSSVVNPVLREVLAIILNN